MNGTLFKPFCITNGTRQGCPLSPLIFALVIESIQRDPQVQGVNIANVQHKINIFLTLTNIESSLQHSSHILHEFSKISYYRVNSSKSLVLGFSVDPSTKTNIPNLYPYAWNDTSIPYLEIHLKHTSLLLAANFHVLLKSVQTDHNRLARVDNSWLGGIVIYKMIIL